MKDDPRKIVGNIIVTKAVYVTNVKTVMAIYGTKFKEKEYQGTITSVNYLRKSENGPAQCYVTATYTMGNNITKSVRMHLSKVKSFIPTEATINADNPIIPPSNIAPVDANMNATIEAPAISNDNDANVDDYTDETVNALTRTQLEVSLTTLLDSPVPAIPALATIPPPVDNNNGPTENFLPTSPLRPVGLYRDVADSPLQPTNPSAVANNDKEWHEMPHQILLPLNGQMASYQWGMKLPTGEKWKDNSNSDGDIKRLDVFLQLFPPKALNNLLIETNINIRNNNSQDLTSKSELLKFIGIILLGTKFDWDSRADLWSTINPSKYVPAANFGKVTNMSRDRFNFLWQYMRFSHQPAEMPEGMSSQKYRWMLVDDFVDEFNKHRSVFFIPGFGICVDESFSRWYGKGGSWINEGLPLFIVMDRKPDDGCELWTCCCCETGVMLQIMVVKAEEDREHGESPYNHGTTILSSLVSTWNGSKRLVVADSYFSSVEATLLLKDNNLNFIGVVKTATKGYPIDYLKRIELQEKGDRAGLISKDKDGNPELMAFVLRDRDRRYFISNCSSLAEGNPVSRQRWRQTEKDNITPPEKLHITFPQPQAADLYYECCGKIDQHNRDRCATLGIERKYITKDWSKRVNLTILSMCFVDSWKVWSHISKDIEGTLKETQKDFYGHLAAELIDNVYDGIRRRNAAGEASGSGEVMNVRNPRTGEIRRGLDIHLTPTKRRRITDGVLTKHAYQGRCSVCGKKSMLICSSCDDDPTIRKDCYICDPKNGTSCWPDHLSCKHNL